MWRKGSLMLWGLPWFQISGDMRFDAQGIWEPSSLSMPILIPTFSDCPKLELYRFKAPQTKAAFRHSERKPSRLVFWWVTYNSPPKMEKKHPKRFGPFFGRPWTPIDSFVASIRKPMWITGWFTMTRGSGSTSKKALGSEGGEFLQLGWTEHWRFPKKHQRTQCGRMKNHFFANDLISNWNMFQLVSFRTYWSHISTCKVFRSTLSTQV